MQPKVLNGKKPLSQKGTAPGMNTVTDDIFGNPLALPPELQKELEDKGLVGRFVSSKILYSHQGYHPKGWRAYKSTNAGKVDGVEFKLGSDPDGLVRRGDCILAVKTVEEHAKHKAKLQERADRYKGYAKSKKKELQDQARAAGANSHVDDSPDFEGEDDDNED